MKVVFPPETAEQAERRWENSEVRAAAKAQALNKDDQLREDIREHLTGEYLLHDGTIVYGNSTSHTLDCTRHYNTSGRRWRNLGGDAQFEDLCERLGFVVRRGRARRVFAGGKTGWGVPCDVITEEKPVPLFDVFDIDGKKLNAEPLVPSDALYEVHEYNMTGQELIEFVQQHGAYLVHNEDFTKPPVAQTARFCAAERKARFIAALPSDFQERIAVGELYVDQDEDTGLCSIHPNVN